MTGQTEPTRQFNDTGTHVLTTSPTGEPWWCPVDYLPFALDDKGFTLAGADEPTPGEVTDPPLRDFDPDDHDVAAVNAHLAAAAAANDQAEVDRVLALEAAGKDRSTVAAPTDD